MCTMVSTMGKEHLAELLKKGPSLTYLADRLEVSRPTLYRQMENYRKGEFSKMNPIIRGYFDKVVMGQIANEEEAMKELDQIAFMVEGKKEEDRRLLMEKQDELEELMDEYKAMSKKMSPKDRLAFQERIDAKDKELQELSKTLGEDIPTSWSHQIPERIKWNEGEIRSVCVCPYDTPWIIIDREYEDCPNVTVELMMVISGQDVPIARYIPRPNRKFAVMGYLAKGPQYKYRLKWIDDGKVKTAGPYVIDYDMF